MAKDEVQNKATEPTLKRSLTGSAAVDVAMAFAGGAGAAAGKVVVDQIAQHVTNRPQETESPQVILPSGVQKD
jgi:hypothetical protein